MDKLIIAVVVPDRGDRPNFLNNCRRMISMQTRQPDILEVIDYKPVSDQCDITPRYKMGYNLASNAGADCILFMENDDWYHPEYIEEMIEHWLAHGKPELLGHQYTIYYHLGLRKMSVFHHMHRSSAMNTLIKAGLTFGWGEDKNPYTDSWLWVTTSKHYNWRAITVVPSQLICLGIKHDIGKVGGEFHSSGLKRFTRNQDTSPPNLLERSMASAYGLYKNYRLKGDNDLLYLRLNMDGDSYRFYRALSEKIKGSTQTSHTPQ